MMEELDVEEWDAKNLKCCCPFHHEKTPSFIWNPKNNSAHCFGGCHRSYDIIDIFMHKGMTYIEAVQKLFNITKIQYIFGEHHVKTRSQYRYPKEVMCGDKSKIYKYLRLRKISNETADYLDLRQDEHGNIVFNYYDLNDTLTMVKYRPARKIKKGEIKNWCQTDADTTPLLFNMNRINTAAPLLICSGELDCASAIEVGYTNAVSIPLGDANTHWLEECWDWLEQFESIIICPDNDDSGAKYCKEIVPRLGSWRCKIAHMPLYYETPTGEKLKIKDINDCLYRFGKEKVLESITNAEDAPVASVQDLSDVNDIDLDAVDGITTGINGIDRELMKIFYGTLTIVSGAPGSGKTSFLYQIICQALDQGRNCWMFSRELPAWMTKNWFNYIFAGRRNIKEYKTNNGTEYFKVSPEAKRKINEFYRGRWFVYRDDHNNKLELLIDSMTDVARKYGVKLFLLDNLMTIDIGGTESDELRKQTEAINKLIQFATTYNVAVILVAHPRKLEKGATEVGMYDISGTSNIANLAHRTIGLKRVSQKEKKGEPKRNGKGWETPPCKYDMMFSIIKDRLRGRSNFHYGLYYDIPTRRFFSTPEEFGHNYKWDNTQYTDQLEYPIKDDEDEVYGVIEGAENNK